MSGDLMQLGDVLRDQRVELARALELHQRKMPPVRLRAPCRAAEAVLPGRLAHLRIAEVAMDVRHLLGERIPGPDALRAAEVRDAGVGGDARAGERDDALREIGRASCRERV